MYLRAVTVLGVSILVLGGSALPQPPAAPEHGCLTVRDGHLAWQRGERVRFWGVNLVDEMGREKAEVDQIARRIPQMGFNACRLHLYDIRLIDADAKTPGGQPTSRVPRTATRGDDTILDRFDYATYRLEQEALYLYLTFDRRRAPFQPGDADIVPDRPAADGEAWREAIADVPEGGREQLVYVDDRCAALQLEFTKMHLDHVNPYTGRRIAEDPYVVLYELSNENGFVRDMLDGKHRDWPQYFRDELQRKWNAWLRDRYETNDALLKAWGALNEGEDLAEGSIAVEPAYGNAKDFPSGRLADIHWFVYDLFLGFSRKQEELIRSLAPEGVGCNVVPICYDTVYQHRLAWHAAAAQADFLCVGTYTNEATHDKSSPHYPFTCPLEREPGFYNLSYARAAGKPTVVYENNVLKPAPFRASYPFRVAALASWQDWDAVFWYLWGNGTVKGQDDPQTYVDTGLRYAVPEHPWHGIVISTDEVLCAALRAAGAAFTGFHLDPAPDPLVIDVGSADLTHTSWIGDIDVPTPEGATGRWPKSSALNATNYTRGLRFSFRFDRPETSAPEALVPRLESPLRQNGDITYDWDRGVLIFNSPGAKAIVGFAGDGQEFGDGIALSGVDTDFIAFALVAEPGKSLAATDRAIGILTSTGENVGFEMKLDEWEADPNLGYESLTKSWGKGPVQIERYNATLSLPRSFSATVRDFLLQPIAQMSGRRLQFSREMPVFVAEFRNREE